MKHHYYFTSFLQSYIINYFFVDNKRKVDKLNFKKGKIVIHEKSFVVKSNDRPAIRTTDRGQFERKRPPYNNKSWQAFQLIKITIRTKRR